MSLWAVHDSYVMRAIHPDITLSNAAPNATTVKVYAAGVS